MTPYAKMYKVIFNAVTDALQDLDRMNIGSAKETLMHAQFHTEELYISQAEKDGREKKD